MIVMVMMVTVSFCLPTEVDDDVHDVDDGGCRCALFFRDGNSDDNDLDWRMVIVMSVIVIFSSTAGC